MSDDLIIRAAIRDELSAPLAGIREEIKATGEQAEKAGRKANIGARGFDAMAGGVGRMVKATGRAAVLGLGALTAAIGAVTIGAATMGIKTAAEMQNASVAFTTMLGSGKKAAAFLSDLKKFAAATPFEFPELQTAASSLISAGINAKDVIPIMTTLGNVTSGMGTGAEGVQRATVALQQMSAAGKITGEDLNQLRDAGIPVYDLLAKATGKSKAEVVKLAQAGKLGKKELDQMMSALKTGKGMERFAGLMDKQSRTLGGVWSTLKDTVNMGLANAFGPAIPVLTNLTLAASGLASDKVFPAISRGLDRIVKGAPAAWDALKSGDLDSAVSQLDSMAGAGGKLSTFYYAQLKPALDDLGTIIRDTIIPAIKDAGGIMPSWTTPLGLAKDALGFVADHATAFKVAIEILLPALTAWKVITEVSNGVLAIQAGILKVQAAGGIMGYLKATNLAKAATAVWTGIQAAFNLVMDANPISLVILGIAALAAGLVYAYTHFETFHKIVDGFFGFIRDHWAVILPLMLGPIGLVIVGIVKNFDTIKKAIGAAISWVLGKIDGLLGGLQSMLRALSHVPGFEWAGRAADAIGGARDAVKGLKDQIDGLRDKTVTISVRSVGAQADKNAARLAENGISGDTATSHARGRGGLASTLAVHSALSSGQTITNALVGGGGRGHGSGDHQAGRALDLTGPGLPGYASKLRAAGGYAAMHGAGRARHLHAVYPAGDTARSMTPRVASSRSGGSGPAAPVVIGAGAIVVTNPTSDVDIERAVAAGIRRHLRDAQERA